LIVDAWVLVALVAPGIALIIVGNVLVFPAKTPPERQRAARAITTGFALIMLIPGVAFAVLVLQGRMQPVALIAAGVLIGFGLLHVYAIKPN
jgi:hypothetical protein